MQALKNLIVQMADDAFIIGHRNSEWTGIGPILEEDIAFSSMAQDKIGHAQALYEIIHTEMGGTSPDVFAFKREEKEFMCCQLVELPIGDYAFSLMRHFLYDHCDSLRYELLSGSSYSPLANLAKKIKGELKYHTLHADTWIKKLSRGNEESNIRIQAALNEVYPYALGMFEITAGENEIISEKIFAGELELKKLWIEKTSAIIELCGLKIPVVKDSEIKNGGRHGYHTEYLEPMLNEMREVIGADYNTEW